MSGGGEAIDVSILICSRNRDQSLGRLLESVAALEVPDRASWEVVVNNGSTDGTDTIVAQFEGRLPVRLIQEPKVGVSHARNRGVDFRPPGCGA